MCAATDRLYSRMDYDLSSTDHGPRYKWIVRSAAHGPRHVASTCNKRAHGPTSNRTATALAFVSIAMLRTNDLLVIRALLTVRRDLQRDCESSNRTGVTHPSHGGGAQGVQRSPTSCE